MKPMAHSTLAATQRDELPTTAGKTWGIRSLHLKVEMMHHELRMLVQELWPWNLHWATVQEWGSNKLTGL
jgi:hypothetical protein